MLPLRLADALLQVPLSSCPSVSPVRVSPSARPLPVLALGDHKDRPYASPSPRLRVPA